MNLLALVLAGLVSYQTQTTNIETKEDYVGGNLQSIIQPAWDSVPSNNRVSIIPGDSQLQIRQRAESERKRAVGGERPQAIRSGGQNPYVYGYCTWYVAEKKGIKENYGNARNWPINSQEPQKGAVVVMRTSNPLGHVAYTEEVNSDTITISEYNWSGWNSKTTRTISKHDPSIKGYLII